MTHRTYSNKRLGEKVLLLIDQAATIVDEYQNKGFTLTLRQLYYQFVSRGLFENEQRNYSRLGDAVSDGRMAGLISWTAIEDRTRFLRGTNTHESPAEILEAARNSYQIDRWRDQPWRPEVWVEKDALIGVIEPICNQLCVDYFACRGYNSQSEAWRAGQRFARYIQKGQRPIVFHLGDHDPSGLDMTRDNQERLSLFCGVQVQVVRLALNRSQVDHYNPPPNPAKMSDSRAADYVEEHGDQSWELDALPPEVIRDLISSSILKLRDPILWDAALSREAQDKNALDEIIEGFDQ